MTRSTKLGIASAAVVIIAIALAIVVPQVPLGFVAAFVSVILGLLAAQQGSKWWLLIPGILVATFVFLLWVGFHAR
jgi:hypothetical protein